MLNLAATAGHKVYAKWCRRYLQNMRNLYRKLMEKVLKLMVARQDFGLVYALTIIEQIFDEVYEN